MSIFIILGSCSVSLDHTSPAPAGKVLCSHYENHQQETGAQDVSLDPLTHPTNKSPRALARYQIYVGNSSATQKQLRSRVAEEDTTVTMYDHLYMATSCTYTCTHCRDPSIKRTLCKSCDTLLVPGVTCTHRRRCMSSTCTVIIICTLVTFEVITHTPVCDQQFMLECLNKPYCSEPSVCGWSRTYINRPTFPSKELYSMQITWNYIRLSNTSLRLIIPVGAHDLTQFLEAGVPSDLFLTLQCIPRPYLATAWNP